LVADWYYAKDGERFGPFDAQQIKKFAEQGVLLPTDAVTRKGMPQWMQAATVKGLFAEVPQTAPQSRQQPQVQPNSAETKLYQDKDVLVTTERVVLGDTIINVRDIVSTYLDRKKGFLLVWAGLCAFLAVFVGIFSIADAVSMAKRGELLAMFLTIPLGVLPSAGFLFAVYKIVQADKRDRAWRLNIQTNDESIQALNSTDKATIFPVVDAINEALRMRSNR